MGNLQPLWPLQWVGSQGEDTPTWKMMLIKKIIVIIYIITSHLSLITNANKAEA